MSSKLTFAAVIGAATLAIASPALAQGITIDRNGVHVVPQNSPDRGPRGRDWSHRPGQNRGEISEREAVRIAHERGIRDVRAVTKTRDLYQIAGGDRRGGRMRVDIDRYSGRVLGVR